MKLGIVGLPNVGKSTLFNALTKAGAESANYAFCTIDPNVGVVPVPDERLDKLYMNDYASFVERDRIVSELEQLRKQKEELENKLAKTEAHLEKSYVVH